MIRKENEAVRTQSSQNTGLRKRIQSQPPAVRILLGLFILQLGLDFFVLGILQNWFDPVFATPVAASIVQSISQPVSGLRGLAWKAVQQPVPSKKMPIPLQETVSITPFIPRTYPPQSSPTPTFTPTATVTTTIAASPTSPPTATVEPSATPAPPTPQPPTEAPPEPPPLPESALVDGVSGRNQSLPLSCESRSAVDWARFFGVEINELDFQYALPFTDDPETGFVGNPRDPSGMTPPHSYGVYAGPVADLLRANGVSARDHKGLTYDDLRREIVAGRPVIVWVINGIAMGAGFEYTASDGVTSIVAPMEHTVMIVGYTADSVIIQDGGYRYYASVERFMRSWGVLGNMAVTQN
jgi:uncharacterized protein YvpB